LITHERPITEQHGSRAGLRPLAHRPSTGRCGLGIVALSSLLFTGAASINAPPAGFQWVSFDEIEGCFLKPRQWRHHFSKGKLMGSLVMTNRPRQDDTAHASTFTVNVVSNLTKTNFRLVSDQIKTYPASLARQSHVTVLNQRDHRRGDFRGLSVLFRTASTAGAHPGSDAAEHGAALVMLNHRLYLANDARDWLVVVTLSQPEWEWSQHKGLHERMMEGFRLDDECAKTRAVTD